MRLLSVELVLRRQQIYAPLCIQLSHGSLTEHYEALCPWALYARPFHLLAVLRIGLCARPVVVRPLRHVTFVTAVYNENWLLHPAFITLPIRLPLRVCWSVSQLVC